MTGGSSRGTGRRSQRKEEAQGRARQRARRRLAVGLGLVAAVALIAALGGAWWLGRSDDPEVSAGQALYRFDTADYHSLALDPDDPSTIYFGHHFGMKVSHDGGESWQDGTLGEYDAMQQAIPVDEPRRHYATGHDVFQVSDDGGQTWYQPAHDLPDLDIHGFAAAPTDANRLYAFEVRTGGLYTSADGGTTWETATLPPGLAVGILPLSVAYDDPLHVYAGVGNQVMASRDGGESWQLLDGPGGSVIALAVSPDDPGVLLAGTDQGLWKRDSGGTWERLPVETDGTILAVAIHPRQPELTAIIDQNGNFYRSDDGGRSWAER